MATEKNDYDAFDASDYVLKHFRTPAADDSFGDFMMECLARFYTGTMSGVASNSLKVLDYGCGPSIGLSISAAPKASEIILAEYSPGNREYIQKWLDKSPTLCDHWSPYFKHVVQTLEGGSEKAAVQRQDMLREKIKAVLPCDLREEAFIPEAYGKKGSYDVVMSSTCIETCSNDLASYERGFEKVASLVKKDGYLLLSSTHREGPDEGFYVVDGEKYYDISLTKEFVTGVFKKNNFNIIDEDNQLNAHRDLSNSDGFLFFAARKSM